MVAVVLGLKYVLPDLVGLYWQLVTYTVAGAFAYLLVMLLIRPVIFRQLLNLVSPIMPRGKMSTN